MVSGGGAMNEQDKSQDIVWEKKQIHRVNNNLGAILGFGALLQRHLAHDEEAQTYLEHILHSAREALEHTSQLADRLHEREQAQRTNPEQQRPVPVGQQIRLPQPSPPAESNPGQTEERGNPEPTAPTATLSPNQESIPQDWFHLKGCESILIVEDDPSFRSLLCTFFEQLDYHVVYADNGQTAVEIFAQDPQDFDLVCIDRDLPKLDGHAVAQQIRAIRPHIRLILLSGSAPEEDAEHQNALQFSAVLKKPVALHQLATIVRQVLETDVKPGKKTFTN